MAYVINFKGQIVSSVPQSMAIALQGLFLINPASLEEHPMFNISIESGSILSGLLARSKSKNRLLLFGKMNYQQSRVRVGNRMKNVRWNSSTVAIGENCCYTHMML